MWPFNQRQQVDNDHHQDSFSTTQEESFDDDDQHDQKDLHKKNSYTSNSNSKMRRRMSNASSLEDFPGDKARRRASFVSFDGDVEDQIITAEGLPCSTGQGLGRRDSLGKQRRESLPRRRDSLGNTSRRNSMLGSLRDNYDRSSMLTATAKRDFRFYTVTIVLPCVISIWYCVAILFPPALREKYSMFLWDNGKLRYDDDGEPILCPPESPAICSEGVLELELIALARISAFASYVIMGVTFISKMHFTLRFLASSYLRMFVPFESLHKVHTTNGKIFCILALVHAVAHYIRYILRRDVDQLKTKVHVTGLIAILSMVTVILSMSSVAKRFKNSIGKYERRFNAHWIFVVLCIALCLHHRRTRVITLIFFGLWSLDYTYGLIFATYSLDVVELLPLSDSSGVQMLFQNPDRFHPKSGEYVKIQLPWLTTGGSEWHPFSIYLRESTKKGFHTVHGIDSNRQLMSKVSSNFSREEFESSMTLEDFIHVTLISEYQDEAMDAPTSLLMEEARTDLKNRFPTTQVFINPVGDWSEGLLKDVQEQKQLRACWVRGPYTSPYTIAQNFSHLVLTASGIGITPALGVMGQYPGFTRTKILVWLVRDAAMLKFFAPLIQDAHLAVVFYTGKERLKSSEVRKINSNGNIFIQQSRPASLTETIGGVIVQFENHLNLSNAETVKEIAHRNRSAWCILYCGGSVRIRDDLRNYSKDKQVQFECEMFDW